MQEAGAVFHKVVRNDNVEAYFLHSKRGVLNTEPGTTSPSL